MDYIQGRYWEAIYDASKLTFAQIKAIILEAWNAVPESFIERLYKLLMGEVSSSY